MPLILEHFETFVGLNMPEANGSPFMTAGKGLSIRTGDGYPDTIGMALECLNTLACCHFPETQRLVVSSADQDLSIRMKADRTHTRLMAL